MATITFHHAGRAEIANLINSTRDKKTKLRVPEHKSISHCTETFSQSMMCHSFSGTSIFSFSIIFNTIGHHDTQSEAAKPLLHIQFARDLQPKDDIQTLNNHNCAFMPENFTNPPSHSKDIIQRFSTPKENSLTKTPRIC